MGSTASSPASATKMRPPSGAKTTPRGSSPTSIVTATLNRGGSIRKIDTVLESQFVTAPNLPSADTATQNGCFPTGASIATTPFERSTSDTELLVLLAVMAQLASGVS